MKSRLFMVIALLFSVTSFAADYGAAGASMKKDMTLGEMLGYALQDEHLALAEYQAIMEKFGDQRPYANIAEAEKTHIAYLETLYKKLGLDMPEVNARDYIDIPGSLSQAAEAGVQAEIANIAMYEKFLKEDLPSEVRDVFVYLKDASEKHLSAFERQLETGGTGLGRNRTGRK